MLDALIVSLTPLASWNILCVWTAPNYYPTAPANAGDIRDLGLIPGREYPLEEEMATYSGILAPMDRGAWRATVNGIAESDMTEHKV